MGKSHRTEVIQLEVIQLEASQLEASRWGSPPKAKLESFGESMEACWEEWAAQRLAGYCQRNLATEHVDRSRLLAPTLAQASSKL